MRFLVAPIFLTLAACASTAPREAPPISLNAGERAPASVGQPLSCGPSASVGAAVVQRPLIHKAAVAFTPPLPMPPGPPDAPAYLASPEPTLQPTGDPRLDAWRARVFAGGGPGWRPYLLRAFAGVRSNPAILEDVEEKPRDIAAYVARYVTGERIAAGQRLYRQLESQRLFEGEQKVPLEILLALWGALSDYGAKPPRFDMIEALANLGACGKGPPWGSFSIYQAVGMIAEGKVERAAAKAYGDGRIGQNRLFTEQYLNWAEDGDGDGRVDIWTSRADILKNIQRNALGSWEAGVPAMAEIHPITYDPGAPNDIRRLRASVGWEGAHRRIDGAQWPASAEAMFGWESAVQLGPDGPTYVVSRNLDPIGYQDPFRLVYYAEAERGFPIAIALLADRIAGRAGPSRPIR